MEGRLVPWGHFVPLDSPQDVDAKLRWCRDNPEHVQAIVANATAFMKQFAHEEDERELLRRIVRRYQENVVFVQ